MIRWGLAAESFFQQPFEIVFIVAATGLGLLDNKLNWIVTRTKGIPRAVDVAIWIAAFAVTYWVASCVSEIQKTGCQKVCYRADAVVAYVENAEERSSGSSGKSRTRQRKIVPESERNGTQAVSDHYRY